MEHCSNTVLTCEDSHIVDVKWGVCRNLKVWYTLGMTTHTNGIRIRSANLKTSLRKQRLAIEAQNKELITERVEWFLNDSEDEVRGAFDYCHGSIAAFVTEEAKTEKDIGRRILTDDELDNIITDMAVDLNG